MAIYARKRFDRIPQATPEEITESLGGISDENAKSALASLPRVYDQIPHDSELQCWMTVPELVNALRKIGHRPAAIEKAISYAAAANLLKAFWIEECDEVWSDIDGEWEEWRGSKFTAAFMANDALWDEETSTKPTSKIGRTSTASSGDQEAKFLSVLTAHHQYDNGKCLNLEPIGVTEMARRAGYDPPEKGKGGASEFLTKAFGGHSEYKAICQRDPNKIAAYLMGRHGDFCLSPTYGRSPDCDERG